MVSKHAPKSKIVLRWYIKRCNVCKERECKRERVKRDVMYVKTVNVNERVNRDVGAGPGGYDIERKRTLKKRKRKGGWKGLRDEGPG